MGREWVTLEEAAGFKSHFHLVYELIKCASNAGATWLSERPTVSAVSILAARQASSAWQLSVVAGAEENNT